MGPMVIASLIGRLLTVPLIFLFVHSPSDTMTAIAIGGIGGIVAAIVSLNVATRATPLTMPGAWWQLCDGWHLFVSTAAVMLYTQINVIMVGALAGPVQAGLLFGAQKLASAGKSAIGPLSAAAYPRVNSLVPEHPDQAIRLAKRVLVIKGAITFGLFIVMLAGAPYLTLLFFLSAEYEGAVPAARWLSATVFLVGLSNAFGAQIMLPFGMQRSFMRIMVGAGLLNVAAIAPCSY
jgi:PST family polysaccharide transporter